MPEVVSPYRVCPIGAHVDHQHGPVLGMAIRLGTRLSFEPASGPACALESGAFSERASFDVRAPEAGRAEDWTRYPRAAAWALRDKLPADARGITGRVEGSLAGGGLSSSASLILACLNALALANGIELGAEDQVRLSFEAENGFVGLKSGVLDPAAIVASRRGALALIDTREVRWETIQPAPETPPWRVLVAFSGRTRNLVATGFNQRVEECGAAARRVAAATGLPATERLGDLPEDLLAEALATLPPVEARRARHFVGERERVREGAALWKAGDLAGFGERMVASCRSSIVNFETGSEELVALHELLLEGGCFGARFSGAGFAGCAVGLVPAARAEACREFVERRFAERFPALADSARTFVTEGDDGIRVTQDS